MHVATVGKVRCRTCGCLVARVERHNGVLRRQADNSVIWCRVSKARSAVNGRFFVFVRDAF